MPSESIHEKLQRVRRPHVHIKYEVYIGDARKVLELPFVVGVMGDFAGDSIDDLPALRDREFKEVNRDNFNQMMKSMKPSLGPFQVENFLGDNPQELLTIEKLKFEKMEDFSPAGVAKQIPELAATLKKREEIEELMKQLPLNRALEKDIDKYLKDVTGGSPKQ